MADALLWLQAPLALNKSKTNLLSMPSTCFGCGFEAQAFL
jgi:hypothetical protein